MGFGGGGRPKIEPTPVPPVADVRETEKQKQEKRAKSLQRAAVLQSMQGADQLSGRGTGLRLL